MTASLSLVSRRALLPEGPLRPATVVVEDGVVAGVSDGVCGRVADVDLGDDLLCPGFVDLQVNGFGGVDLQTGDPGAVRAVASALPRSGVTGFVPTVVTAAPEAMAAAVHAIEQAYADQPADVARVLGVHLEGPFLAPARRGVHPVEQLRVPDPSVLEPLLPAAHVPVVVTLAPELAGALDVVRLLVQRGAVVSLGHSDATADEGRRAVDAGARLVTHLFNAQSGIVNRAPGLAALALSDGRLVCGLIADLEHVDATTLAVAWAAASHRIALVTDATSVTDAPGGDHRLGPAALASEGRDSAPRNADGRLAGSALRLDVAVANAARVTGDLEGALRAATATPARALGLDDVGVLRVGARADLVQLSPQGRCRRTWVAGREVFREPVR